MTTSGTGTTHSRLLEPLSEADRRRVLAAAHRRRFPRDTVVFWAGDPGDSLHLIVSGHVAVEIRRLSAALTDALYLPAADQLWKRMAALESVFAGEAPETVLSITQSM